MGMAKPTERALFLLGGAGTDKTKGSTAIRSVTGTRIATENLRLGDYRNEWCRVPLCTTPYIYDYRTDSYFDGALEEVSSQSLGNERFTALHQ